jgi:hypothetical protein
MLLAEVSATTATTDRIAELYGALLPALAQHYGRYLETADPILDEPSVRIIERIATDIDRMIKESRELTTEYPQFGHPDSKRVLDLAKREAMVPSIIAAQSGRRRRSA